MLDGDLTSEHFILIARCKDDFIDMPGAGKVHKEVAANFAVYFDCVSIIILIVIMTQLNTINAEYLEDLQAQMVQMTNFTVVCKGV